MLKYLLLLLPIALAQRGISPPRQGATGPDGSVIVEGTYQAAGNINLRYKVAAPASAFANAPPPGPNARALGLNVLLHGDGGASFEAFPNADITTSTNGRLAGVVVLAPNAQALWGGQSTRNRPRPQGDAHSRAVNDLIKTHLPTVLRFNPQDVWFTGVSGGAIMLSGFFLPTYLNEYKTGAMLLCGGMAPTAERAAAPGFREALATARIHWQATQNEQPGLKTTITQGVNLYSRLAGNTAVQTVDASPAGRHCVFDNRGFNSGIQLMVNNWGKIMFGDGAVPGVGNVNKNARQVQNPFGRN